MPVAVPAAIAALLELAAIIVSVLLLLAAVCALYAYRYTLGQIVLAIARLWDKVSFGIGGNPATKLDNAIKAALGSVISSAEWTMSNLFLGTALLWHYITSQMYALAHDIDGVFERGVSGVGRKVQKWVQTYVQRELKGVWSRVTKYVNPLVHALGVAITGIHHLIRTLRHDLTVVANEVKAIRGFTAKQLRALLRKVRALEWLAGFAGVGALVGAGLKKLDLSWLRSFKGAETLVGAGIAALGLKWLTCEFTKQFGRRMCGSDGRMLNALMDDLLAAGVDILAITHLCELAGVIQRGAVFFEPVIHTLVTAAESYVCAGHEGAASAIDAGDWAALSGPPSEV